MKFLIEFCIILTIVFIVITHDANALTFPNKATAALSITADDGWSSQKTQAEILDSYGWQGTFYLYHWSQTVADAGYWRSAYQAGHEIGNHSYSHWSPPTLATKTWQQVASDVGAMEAWLTNNIWSGSAPSHTFAYPQGSTVIGDQTTLQGQRVGKCEWVGLLSASVNAGRTTQSGYNIPSEVRNKQYLLKSTNISGDDMTAFNTAKTAIDAAIANQGWQIIAFHSLGDSPDGLAITQNAYVMIMNYIESVQSQLYIAPVITVKQYIGSQILNTSSIGCI